MSDSPLKIADVLKSEYPDFVDFCSASGKCYVNELTGVDYVAFRSAYGLSRGYVNNIKSLIENYSPDILAKDTDKISSTNEADIILQSAKGANPEKEEDRRSEKNVINDSSKKATNDVQPPKQSRKEKNQFLFDDEQHTLEELFDTCSELFENDNIKELNLNMHSCNCLKRASIHTVYDLLSIKPSELIKIKNVGIKTASEIFEKCKVYVDQHYQKKEFNSNSKHTSVQVNRPLINAVRSMLSNEEYHGIELSDEEKDFLDKLRSSRDIIGPELCIEAMDNSQYIVKVCQALYEFCKPYEKFYKSKKCVENRIPTLPISTKDKKAIPFVYACMASTGMDFPELLDKCDDNTKICDIPRVFACFRGEYHEEKMALEINRFFDWLDFDINDIVSEIGQQMLTDVVGKNPRTLDIFKQRIEGKTLDEIGTSMDLTRERVRQIEKNAIRIFWNVYRRQKCDLIMSIYALYNGKPVLFYKDLNKALGNFTPIIWSCVKKSDGTEYFSYSKEIDAISIKSGKSGKDTDSLLTMLNEAIKSLPWIIRNVDLNDVINTVSKEYSLPKELIAKHINEQYTQDGQFYHYGRLTVVFMCLYVLKERFPSGFKIADDFESKRFQQFLYELFGDCSSQITSRAIDSKVTNFGCLCDRGKYIHPDLMNVDKSYMKIIYEYIKNSPRKVLPYAEIYEDLREKLVNSPIVNRYYLQGTIKKYGCDFKMTRDAIVKDTSVSFTDELESFVEERGITNKNEILAEFTSLTETSLGQVVSRCSNVFSIDYGNYIHTSMFDIQPSDYKDVHAVLQEVIQDIPVNIRFLSDILMSQCPDFFWRNDFEDRNKLFAALNYMFPTEYSFSRPYVAKLGAGDISNRSVILQHIEDYDSIDIDDLITICDENQIYYVTIPYLCQMLAPDFIRINKTTLMRVELTGIDDDVISSVVDHINEILTYKNYVVASTFDDFLWFPNIEVDWNGFLLESIIVQSKKINTINLICDPYKHPNTVFVSDDYKDETYNSLLVKILKKEVKKGMFVSKVEMKNWLIERGFIEKGLPNFLESAKYFYVDEKGVHISGERDDD